MDALHKLVGVWCQQNIISYYIFLLSGPSLKKGTWIYSRWIFLIILLLITASPSSTFIGYEEGFEKPSFLLHRWILALSSPLRRYTRRHVVTNYTILPATPNGLKPTTYQISKCVSYIIAMWFNRWFTSMQQLR